MATVFAYLFGAIGKYQYRDLIGDKSRAKSVWSLVENNGYILKNCKLYAYAVHVNRALGLPTSPSRFGIYKADVTILRALDLATVGLDHKAYSLFDFDNLETSIVTSRHIKEYIGKFISKKLVFLIRSYGIKREDLAGQMVLAAMFALRKNYPKYETELHALNTCKTAIHNCGIGLIQFYTRTKREALIKDNGDFQAVHVDYSTLSNVGVAPEHDDEVRVNIKAIHALSQTMGANEQAFLAAAAGIYDPGFSMFLGRDNRDAVEVLNYPKYLTQLSSYHHFSQAKQTLLLEELRKALS